MPKNQTPTFPPYCKRGCLLMDLICKYCVLCGPGGPVINCAKIVLYVWIFKTMIAFFVLILSAFGIGRFVLWKMHCVFPKPLENVVSSVGIGLGAWCYVLFLLGHLGLLYPWLFMVIALASAVPAIAWIAKNIRQARFQFPEITFSFFDAAALTLTFGLLALTLICCFSPVVGGISNDEIATHLSVPKSWLLLHKIVALPDSSSAIAGHIELLFLWVMAFAPESGPKLFSWICLLLCMTIMYNFTRDKIGARAALYACIFTVINPLIFRVSCTAFIDIPAAFFLLLALWALWRFNGTGKKALLFLSAFFIGTGCGAKPTVYFYVPAFFILCAVVLFSQKKRGITFIKTLAWFSALVCVFAAPWPARNIILSGSPTFPPPLFLYALHGNRPFVFSGQPYTKKDASAMYDLLPLTNRKTWHGHKKLFLIALEHYHAPRIVVHRRFDRHHYVVVSADCFFLPETASLDQCGPDFLPHRGRVHLFSHYSGGPLFHCRIFRAGPGPGLDNGKCASLRSANFRACQNHGPLQLCVFLRHRRPRSFAFM